MDEQVLTLINEWRELAAERDAISLKMDEISEKVLPNFPEGAAIDNVILRSRRYYDATSLKDTPYWKQITTAKVDNRKIAKVLKKYPSLWAQVSVKVVKYLSRVKKDLGE